MGRSSDPTSCPKPDSLMTAKPILPKTTLAQKHTCIDRAIQDKQFMQITPFFDGVSFHSEESHLDLIVPPEPFFVTDDIRAALRVLL